MPPAHRHRSNDEAHYVLEGEVTLDVGDRVTTGSPGTFVLAESGEVHTFGNASARPARLLILHAPGLDGYFEELATLWGSDEAPTRDAELELMGRQGMEPA